jgi:signal-transduction protein with cAMP-binding, CBS, and nucleotidyltransferase domain
MSSPIVVVPPELSVDQALTLMRRRGIHSLVVDLTTDEPAYGIVTTTDIRDKIVAKDLSPGDVTVREIMNSPIACAKPDWSLKEASLKMQELNIHHLPVEDERGSLVGMISATDIFIAVEESGWDEIA